MIIRQPKYLVQLCAQRCISVRRVSIAVGLSLIVGPHGTSLVAQAPSGLLALPTLQYPTPAPARHSVTTIGSGFDLRALRWYGQFRTEPAEGHVPNDSIRENITTRARAWMANFVAESPRGMYLDDAGRIAVQAGEDSAAQRYFTARLSVPHLTASDSAYTLYIAIESFADTTRPARLSIAVRYLAQLQRLPSAIAGVAQYRALTALAQAYDALEQGDLARFYGFQALTRLGDLPYVDRWVGFDDPALYLLVAHRLMELPDGRAQVARVNTMLMATTVPPGVAAHDSALASVRDDYSRALRSMIESAAVLGTHVDSLRATHLWNMPQATSGTGGIALNDGVPRILFFAGIGCCKDEFAVFERVHRHLTAHARAASQIVFVTATTGSWNDLLVPTEEEVRRLRAMYLDSLKLTLPIMLWAGDKRATSYGGTLPVPSPNMGAFHVIGAPYIVIVDGQGTIRHLFVRDWWNRFSRADEARAVALVTALSHHHDLR